MKYIYYLYQVINYIFMVYFLRDENNYVKIGFSNNVVSRISYLEMHSPYNHEVILILDGGFTLEQELHKKFRQYHKTGEWFYCGPDINDFVLASQDKDLSWVFGRGQKGFKHGTNIKEERIRQGLSMADFADMLSVSPQTICEMERRELHQGISIKRISKAAAALGKKFEYRFV